MRHRRAAELIRLVFSDPRDPTRMIDGEDWPSGRERFEKTRAASGNPLIRLGAGASDSTGKCSIVQHSVSCHRNQGDLQRS